MRYYWPSYTCGSFLFNYVIDHALEFVIIFLNIKCQNYLLFLFYLLLKDIFSEKIRKPTNQGTVHKNLIKTHAAKYVENILALVRISFSQTFISDKHVMAHVMSL